MTGTCPGGLVHDHPTWKRFAEAIAQTILLLRPREFVELEVGPLSPIPFLGEVSKYVCDADNRLVPVLREYREKTKELSDIHVVEMDALQAYVFFNHPGTIFYTSRFVGCPSKGCSHCNFYATLPLDHSMNAVLQSLDLLAPDSQLILPFGTSKLISGEVENGIEILWSVHVKDNVFLSLVRKKGLRRLSRDPTHYRSSRSNGGEACGSS